MNVSDLVVLPLTVLALGPALAQPVPPSQDQREPVLPPAGPAATPVGPEEAPWDMTQGESFQVAVDDLDDGVPLPIPPQVRETPAGDVLIAPASGDPFFLGFAAGPYHPPAQERIDPLLLSSARLQYDDGRPQAETYAFVMFAKRITAERLAALQSSGARVLEFHPHYTMKVALPAASIDLVAALDFVRWIGVPRTWQKQHPSLQRALAELRGGQPLAAWVNVFDSDLNDASTSRVVGATEEGGPDGLRVLPEGAPELPREWMSNGWQQRELERLGLEVRAWEEPIRAFRVLLRPESLPALLESDFVQFVEPEGVPSLTHDESMPMVNMDRTRLSYDGGTNDVVVVGQADSGIDYSHQGLTGFYWWGNNLSGTSEATTTDLCGHGSHVNGTIRGRPSVHASYEGGANGLAQLPTTRFFNTKIFQGSGCSWGGSTIATILGVMDNAVTDGSGNVTPRPHVINHSWGTTGSGPYFGTEAACRTIDGSVYSNSQLHVWAAGNEGSGGQTLRMEPSSKNVLTVGNVVDYEDATVGDPGHLWVSSSRGPTADLRWKPNVVAPGRQIYSADAHTTNGYTNKSGTSMAAPHVTALAAQLVDHYSFLRYNPATTTAVLMGKALTKDDVTLGTPSTSSTHHMNMYGAGRIEAYNAHWSSSQQSGYYYGWTLGTSGYVYVDIPVNTGATRLVACMNYNEVAASSGASQALVNDLDLWIDAPPIQSGGNTGEYFAQQSSRDNSEIRIIDNPTTGTWRIKIYVDSATSNTKAGLSVMVVYGDTTPGPNTSIATSDLFVKPNENVTIDFDYSVSDWVASAVLAKITTTGDLLQSAKTTLVGGVATDLMNNQADGRAVLLGDVIAGTTRSAEWVTRWPTEGVKSFNVVARSENALDSINNSVTVTVDGTPPGVISNLASSTHPVGVWKNSPSFSMTFSSAPDNLVGILGYGVAGSSGAPALPPATQNLGNVTFYNAAVPDGAATYVNVRAVDKSGNWSGSYASYGPIKVDSVDPAAMTNLHSTSHTMGVQSCSTSVQIAWDPVTDALSGMAGFSTFWDHSPNTQPDAVPELAGNLTSASYTVNYDEQPHWFHIRPLDNAGNGSTTYHLGPFQIGGGATTYCTAKATSIPGCVPAFSTSGIPSLSGSGFDITWGNVPGANIGLFIYTNAGPALAPANTPYGWLCINSGSMYRTGTVLSGGNTGVCDGAYKIDFVSFANTQTTNPGMGAGSSVDLQCWYRDPPNLAAANLSNAIRFTLCQ